MAEAALEQTTEDTEASALRTSDFVRQALRLLRPYWGRCVLIFLTILIQLAFYLSLPIAFQMIFGRAIYGGDSAFLVRLLGALAGGFVLVALAELLLGYLAADVGVRAMNDLRLRMFDRLQRLPMGFYSRNPVGDLMSRFSNDLNAIEKVLTNSLYEIAGHSLVIAGAIVLLFTIEWRLALATVVVLPLTAIIPELINPLATRAGYKRKQDEADLSNLVQEGIQGQKVIRSFGLQETVLDRFRERLGGLYQSGVRANLLSDCVGRSLNLGVLIIQLVVIAFGAYLSIKGYLTAGELVGFIMLLFVVGDSAGDLANVMPNLVQATGGMQRINELLEEAPPAVRREDQAPMSPFSREIRFEGVTFSYTGDEVNLDDISFSIPVGRSVAFVGRSGSGKSTVLNLLTRFYDSSRGTIAIDGRDLEEISQDSLLSQMGTVSQEPFLFSTTIRENIRLGRLDASDEEVEEAARGAQVHDFIVDLPQGYDTQVGEMGGRFSGGQRQRIVLARAILRNPSILLLDEATSALDPSTEAAVNATLEELARDRTLISVTHRLSSVLHMDCIFVLDGGRLVEQGTHKELLNLKGTYYTMWQEFALELTGNALLGEEAETVTGWEQAGPGKELDEESAELDPLLEVDSDELSTLIQRFEAEQEGEQQEMQRLREINQRWAQLVGTDRLTGLPNKLSFLEALVPQEIQQAQRTGDSIGFILISGDNLGPINETHGRDAGDQVLGGLSEFLQSVLKGEEQLGHIDGTHFAVVFHPAALEDTRQRAEDLRAQVEAHGFACADTTVHITISAGVWATDSADITDPRAEAEEALHRLNGPLYQAKQVGGNRVEVVAEPEAE